MALPVDLIDLLPSSGCPLAATENQSNTPTGEISRKTRMIGIWLMATLIQSSNDVKG